MLKEQIRKFSMANAYEHKGRAQPASIVGKLIGAGAISHSEIGKTMPLIKKIVEEVNKLPLDKQEAELEKIYPEFFNKKKEEKTLPDLRGKVITRFEPSPSGPMHVGHAYVLALNAELARRNKGKCIVRISDTNPENIYPKAYSMLKEDARWLTRGFVKDVIIQSDRMKIYYKYAEKALSIGAAYVCTCRPEAWKKLALAKQSCPCRSAKNQLERWKHMLTDWKEGSAVVRIKTDLSNRNPALRDWPALRINMHRHPRQGKKYRVWPLMNFAVAIDDHEMRITHTVRAKEHRDNAKRQQYLYDAFGWKMPKHFYIGAINFIGLRLSTTQTRLAIEEGKYTGWDDVRLPFLVALKRRGYQPEALIKYALEVGISENDKTVDADEFFKQINKFNREVLDAKSDRYFFVGEPVEVKGKFAKEVKLKVHPDRKKTRTIKVGNSVFIEKEDYKAGREVRLKGLANVILGKVAKVVPTSEAQTVHWVSKPHCTVEVLMPNGKVIKGIGEPLIAKIKPGEIVQFFRKGFVRCEKAKKFVFAHR